MAASDDIDYATLDNLFADMDDGNGHGDFNYMEDAMFLEEM